MKVMFQRDSFKSIYFEFFRLPLPAVPPMTVVKDVLVDGLIIAIVAYTISISMANIFAHKHDYKVDANQELIANVSCYCYFKINLVNTNYFL